MGRVDEAGLIDFWEEIEQDSTFAYLRTPGTHLVPGIGASRPLAMVVGEAPGATENARREPFCGASGQVLHQLMAIAGLYAKPSRSALVGYEIDPNVWLTNAIKYRPPGNRTPTMGEQMAARPYLRREWKLIGRPRLIVAVGSVAADVINAHAFRMHRGEIYETRAKGVWISYQYHPAYGLRSPQMQPTMERQWESMSEQILTMKKELRWE